MVLSTRSDTAHHSRVMASSVAVDIRGVTAGYVEDQPVLHGLDLSVPTGGITRLVGPNGTGKSTVVELVSGYLRPWSGTVTLWGMPADSIAVRDARRIVRTAPALYEYMTVRDHLALFAKITGESPEVLVERAERLGLARWFDENARALSAGTAKKLWYVLGTAGRPQLYVLDEPFNAVDETATATMVADLMDLAATRSVLIVCHAVPAGLLIDQELSIAPKAVR